MGYISVVIELINHMTIEQKINMLPVYVTAPDVRGTGTDLANLTPARQRLLSCQAKMLEPLHTPDIYMEMRVSFQRVFDLYVAKRQVDKEIGVDVDELNFDSFTIFVANLQTTTHETCDERGSEIATKLYGSKRLSKQKKTEMIKEAQRMRETDENITCKTANTLQMLDIHRRIPAYVKGRIGIDIEQMFDKARQQDEADYVPEIIEIDYIQE